MRKKNPDDDLETTHIEIVPDDQLRQEKQKSLPPPGATTDWQEADQYLKDNLPPEVYANLKVERQKLTMEQARLLVAQLKYGRARIKE